MILEQLKSPRDLKSLSARDLEMLAEEVRARIISVCLKNGGHIGASLGAVEIAIAIHRVFESPREAILWDVGHQAYAHKLLTGRDPGFDSLRKFGGLSGFLSREESEHDIFGAGHSSTSLSAALGVAYRNPEWTVAVVGDGGLTAGVALEALNQFSRTPIGPTLVVLNDNRMSISENVGAIHEILAGGKAREYFSLLGFDYVGPVDGHRLEELLAVIDGIHANSPADGDRKPILLHVLTQKGRGYAPAEESPVAFHGVSPAMKSTEKKAGKDESKAKSWSAVFGEALVRLAERDPKVVAITAAMSEGTGLVPFSEKFPDRFFDVGIAEPHAVTFAAGLAARGWKPVVAIYSTFLQRGIDAMIHDVCLQKLPVVFAVDRAGLVGADGPTHHGVFDLTYASMIPGLAVDAPETAGDLEAMLAAALRADGPSLIRYPRGNARVDAGGAASVPFRWRDGAAGDRRLTISIGPIGARVRKAAPEAHALQLLRVSPIPEEALARIRQLAPGKIHVFEEGIAKNGIGTQISARLNSRVVVHGVGDGFVPHGGVADLDELTGLSEARIAADLDAEDERG